MATAGLREFIDLMADYVDFFEGMADDEGDRFLAISSMNCKEVEQSVFRQQSNAMRLKKMEEMREGAQERLGLADKTFCQIAVETPGEEGEELSDLFYRLSDAVQVVQYYHGKSLKAARESMKILHEKMPAGGVAQGGYTPETIHRKDDGWGEDYPLFETKI